MARIASLFDSVTVGLIMKAFDDACERLDEPPSDDARSLIAKRIIGTAALGERDPSKMRDDALTYVTS